MPSNNRSLLIGAMAALAVAGGAPAPTARATAERAPMVRSTGNRLLDMLSGVTPGKQSQPRYIKRPRHTNAEMKRKAIKARNRRRHKLAMKRRGHGNA